MASLAKRRLTAVVIGLFATNANAVPVTLSGTIANSCVLTLSSSGVLVADAAGTTLRSDAGVGARGATMTVVALGAAPTLTFSAPTASGPSGFMADAIQFSYSIAGSGASRGFAASGATASSNLIDTVTVHGQVQSAAGFPAGTYSETVNVTCG